MKFTKNIKKRNSRLKSIANHQKNFFQGIVILIFISLLIIFFLGDHGVLKLYNVKKERKKIQAEIIYLRNQKEETKLEKNKLENDLQYIEKLAREKYKMVKPGEKVFKVVTN